MELSKVHVFDLFENNKNDLLDFFVEPLVGSIMKAEEKNNLHIGFFGDRDRENSEVYMALYLSEALGTVFFYEKCKEDRDFFNNLKAEQVHSVFYAYEISRFNADCSLITSGTLDLNPLFIRNPYKLQYQCKEGQTNYIIASILKRKLDHKRSLMYFILNNLAENFLSYAQVVKNTVEGLKISKDEARQKIDKSIERYEVALKTNNAENKKNIEKRLSILSKFI